MASNLRISIFSNEFIIIALTVPVICCSTYANAIRVSATCQNSTDYYTIVRYYLFSLELHTIL